MNNYSELSTVELRTLVRERGLAKGGAVASAAKQDLIDLLEGASTGLVSPSLPSAGPAAAKPASGQADGLADMIAAALQGRITAGVDAAAVQSIVDASMPDFDAWATALLAGEPFANAIKSAAPKSAGLVINMPELSAPVDMTGEPVHCQFVEVLTWLRADVPVWLWGAPGGGKTHFGRQLAKALGIPSFVMSIDETTTANKLLGFQNLVSGDFVPGQLYEPYKGGGLVVIDEIDTGNPGIIAGLNALLANDHYMFPNGETVPRHPQFRVVAAANTNGTGAVAGFTARQRLDAATLNRFAVISLRYDEGLELHITCGVPSETTPWTPGKPASNDDCVKWVKWVQSVRGHAGRNVLISPRASILGCKALRAGVPVREVEQALVFALCSKDTVSSIIDHCGHAL